MSGLGGADKSTKNLVKKLDNQQKTLYKQAQAQQSNLAAELARQEQASQAALAAQQQRFAQSLETTSQSIQKGIQDLPLPRPTRSPTELDPSTQAAAGRLRERAMSRRGRLSTILTG